MSQLPHIWVVLRGCSHYYISFLGGNINIYSLLKWLEWWVTEVILSISRASKCGNPFFTLYSSLIILPLPLSLSSLFVKPLPFFSMVFSPLIFLVFLSKSCLLLSLFQMFILQFLAVSLSPSKCLLRQRGIPGWSAQGAAMRAALWRTALCGVAYLAFVLLQRKKEGTQRGRAKQGGVILVHKVWSFWVYTYCLGSKRDFFWVQFIDTIEVIWKQWLCKGNNQTWKTKILSRPNPLCFFFPRMLE